MINIDPINDLETEQAVLGSMLIDERAVTYCVGSVVDSDFYYAPFRSLFNVIKDLSTAGIAIDIVTVYNKIVDTGLDLVPANLTTLIEAVPASSNIETYVKRLKEVSKKRFIIKTCQDKIAKIGNKEDPDEVIGLLLEELTTLSASSNEIKSLGSILGTVYDNASKEKVDSISFGIDVKDRILPGEYVIIGARPSTGKTALATQMAFKNASAGVPIGFISLEMTESHIGMRFITSVSGIPSRAIGALLENGSDFMARLAMVNDGLIKLPIHVIYPAPSIASIAMIMRSMVANYGIKMIVIDYIQLIDPELDGNRNTQLTKISQIIKHTTTKLNVSSIVLSQLSRNNKYESRKPELHDLRDSGSLEADADIVILLSTKEALPDKNRIVTHDIAKNRNGEMRETDLLFETKTITFRELPPELKER